MTQKVCMILVDCLFFSLTKRIVDGLWMNCGEKRGPCGKRASYCLGKAVRTAMLCYVNGEELKLAFKTAFEMRSILNDMIDAGYTDEMIRDVWDEAER